MRASSVDQVTRRNCQYLCDTIRCSTSQHGLSLLEVLLAISIFALVVSTIYGTMQAGIGAFRSGTKSMDLYQGIRAGVTTMQSDIRASMHRLSLPFPEPPILLGDDDEPLPHPDDNLQITFTGTRNSVTMMIPMYLPADHDFPVDIREITYRVNNNMLMREITRSLFKRRLGEILYQRHCGDETRFSYDFYMEGGVLLTGEGRAESIVAEDVTSMELMYWDGDMWADSWDSEEFIYVDAEDWEDWPDEIKPRKGLPKLVDVMFYLNNGDAIRSLINIPAAELNDVQQLRGDQEAQVLIRGTRIGRPVGQGSAIWANCNQPSSPPSQHSTRRTLGSRR